MQFPKTATIVESERPNAAGKMVIQVHALGCVHTNIIKSHAAGHGLSVIEADDPEYLWLQAGGAPKIAGVEGAVYYLKAVLSGLMDDGVDNGAWIVRLSPCAKKEMNA